MWSAGVPEARGQPGRLAPCPRKHCQVLFFSYCVASGTLEWYAKNYLGVPKPPWSNVEWSDEFSLKLAIVTRFPLMICLLILAHKEIKEESNGGRPKKG